MKKVLSVVASLIFSLPAFAQVQTCNAKQIAVNQFAICTATLNSDQLLSMNGIYTGVSLIYAPGKNKAIVPNWGQIAVIYHAGADLYSPVGTGPVYIQGSYGTQANAGLLANEVFQSESNLTNEAFGYGFTPLASASNQPFNAYLTGAVAGGNGSITLTIPFTVINVQ